MVFTLELLLSVMVFNFYSLVLHNDEGKGSGKGIRAKPDARLAPSVLNRRLADLFVS